MSDPPPKNENNRPVDGFAAAEIARANLSYDRPPDGPWRKIGIWAALLVWALALVLVARRLFL